MPLLRLTAPAAPPLGYRVARWANRRGLLSDERMDALRNERGSADYRAADGVLRGVLVRVVNELYDEELDELAAGTRETYNGPLTIGEDLLRFHIGDQVTVIPLFTEY